MADDDAADESFTDRIAREGEDVVARLVQELGDHPLVRSLVERAFDARERAAQAQEIGLAALNIPSASDIERLTRRIRSVSLRMEALEDGVDRLDERLRAIEERLERIAADVAAIAGSGREAVTAAPRKPASRAKAPAEVKPLATKPAAAATPRPQPGRAARPR